MHILNPHIPKVRRYDNCLFHCVYINVPNQHLSKLCIRVLLLLLFCEAFWLLDVLMDFVGISGTHIGHNVRNWIWPNRCKKPLILYLSIILLRLNEYHICALCLNNLCLGKLKNDPLQIKVCTSCIQRLPCALSTIS